MMKLLLALVILIPQFAYSVAFAAEDAPKCGLLANASKNLAKEYGEHMAFMFSSGSETPTAIAVAVFLNPKTGTLTMFTVKPGPKGQVVACEFIEGEHWRALKEPTTPDEDEEGDPS